MKEIPLSKEVIALSKQQWFSQVMRELGYEPVRYGKWLDADDGIDWTCSRCGHDAWANTPYCPNCGAKMDEREEDE